MASRRSKWLIGCGAGCGLVVIALIAVFAPSLGWVALYPPFHDDRRRPAQPVVPAVERLARGRPRGMSLLAERGQPPGPAGQDGQDGAQGPTGPGQDVQVGDVLSAVALSLGLSFVVTLFPARRAARMNPVEALRYG